MRFSIFFVQLLLHSGLEFTPEVQSAVPLQHESSPCLLLQAVATSAGHRCSFLDGPRCHVHALSGNLRSGKLKRNSVTFAPASTLAQCLTLDSWTSLSRPLQVGQPQPLNTRQSFLSCLWYLVTFRVHKLGYSGCCMWRWLAWIASQT